MHVKLAWLHITMYLPITNDLSLAFVLFVEFSQTISVHIS